MRNFVKINILQFLIPFLFCFAITGQASDIIKIPSSAPEKGEFRFAAIGDAGTGGKHQLKLARQMDQIQIRTKFSLLLSLGDNIYEGGSPKGIEKKFLKPFEGLITRGVEFRGVIGNHDARSKYGVILQQMIFNMGRKTYYSFGKMNNLVDFFAIDSTVFATGKKVSEATAQLQWLEKSLAKSKARWKIAFLHHIVYSSAKRHGFLAGDDEQMLRVRKALEPLYTKYGVQISLNGHDHVYERTKPQKGVQYFTSGAGAKLRKGNIRRSSPYYAAGNDLERSFMLFSVKPDRITFWSIDSNGAILDSGILRLKDK